MTDRRVKFGLIGCGSVAPYHVKAIQQAANSDLVMVADQDISRAQHMSRRFGVESFGGVDEIINHPGIEAVSIATSHDALTPLGIKAARANKHVIVEKPMALRCRDAENLMDTCKHNGVKLSVWLERRYQPFAIEARSLVEKKSLGQIHLGIINTIGYKKASYWNFGFRDEGPYSTWRGRKSSSGGGVLIMNAFHQLDLMLFITGEEVGEVYGRTSYLNPGIEVENIATVSMKCSSGALINLTATTTGFGLGRYPLYASRDIISGSEGSCILSVPLEIKQKISGDTTIDLPLLDLAQCKSAETEAFADSILNGTEPPVDPRDALSVLKIIESAYLSAETGSPVKI